MMPKELLNQLKQYRKEGFLQAIDIEFTEFLFQLKPETPTETFLAACLTSYFYRQGNVCLPLNDIDSNLFASENSDLKPVKVPSFEDWKTALDKSEIVGSPGSFTPLIFDRDRLYLQKLWLQEQQLGNYLLCLAQKPLAEVNYKKLVEGLARLFPSDDSHQPDYQKIAAATAVLQSLAIISGGPGTGKTTTVVRILALLLEQLPPDKSYKIALAAPTGKAAARLNNSIEQQMFGLQTTEAVKEKIPEQAFTIHRLLGARMDPESFKYNEESKLPHDLVVVDEASMADQRLMNSLLKALKPSARLILLGDKDQLASVEAGSVLGDICEEAGNSFSDSFLEALKKLNISSVESNKAANVMPLTDNIILLKLNFRFKNDEGIAKLTTVIKRGEANSAVQLLQNKREKDVFLKPLESFELFWQTVKPALTEYFKVVNENVATEVLYEKLRQFAILCAHRRGPFGAEAVNREVEKRIRSKGLEFAAGEWYDGRPVIIRRNNYQLQLRNGDIGICRCNETGNWNVIFPPLENSGERIIPVERLSQYNPAFALTVHQSQGSEFENVFIALPHKSSKILTRELLYTAVTRAKKTITVFGREEIVRKMIEQKLKRHSGLGELLNAG